MKNKIIPILISVLLLANKGKSQIVDSTIEKIAEDFPQEKAHLHFDKGIYIKGETIWFKAYLLTGIDLTECSKNFYVDWFDDKGNLLKHTVNPMFESSSRGQFAIPDNYTGKFIHVKAYTQWMLNFDTAFLYHKDIKIDQIGNTNVAKGEVIKKEKKKVEPQPIALTKPTKHTATIQFLPEGGTLLNGVMNRIAFVINNEFGMPVYAVGALKNNKGEFIDSFSTEHDGMGSFSFQPDSTQPISAIWQDEYGDTHTSLIPVGMEIGATLQVEPSRNETIYFIKRSNDAQDNLKTMYVLVSMHQHEVYKAKLNLTTRVAAIGRIPTKDLPSGVMQITLLDSNYVAIAERVVFVNNHHFLFTPEIRITQKGLDRRQKNTLEIEVDDSAFSNMSVAVTDAGLLTDVGHNIVSELLLSGDVKGHIENPAYYFASKEDSVFRQLDLVMLTHGWRKINWKEVVAGKTPTVLHPKETEYMQLKGSIFGDLNKSAFQNQNIFCILQGRDSSKQSFLLPVDKSGNFTQKGVMFSDTAFVYYQLAGNKRLTDRVEIRFKTGLAEAQTKNYSSITPSPFLWNYDVKDTTILERSRMFYNEKEKIARHLAEHQLEEVTVHARVKRPEDVLDEKYTSGLFAGGDSRQFDVTSDPFAAAAQSVFSYLQGRVAGLQINVNGADVTMNWRGHSPDLFLDEVPTTADQLSILSMNDVAYVKVFPPPFFGAVGGGAGGAISVYTRKGGDVKPTPGVGLNFQRLAGYTNYKEFYQPNYENPEATFSEDARTTLYWNPFVLTYGKNHVVQISFYNNDISKRLRLVLEGVNTEGKLARVEKIIE